MIEWPRPLHPGVILNEIYLQPANLHAEGLAKYCDLPKEKIEAIINGELCITPLFAKALQQVLGIDAELWIKMQAEYDLWDAWQRKPKPVKSS